MIKNNEKIGIIILAHGSRIEKANRLVYNIVNFVKTKGKYKVCEPAFLQNVMPDLETSFRKIASKKVSKIIVVPFFLFVGNHVSRDIPKKLQKLKEEYPNIKLIYTQSLGKDKRIANIVLDSIKKYI